MYTKQIIEAQRIYFGEALKRLKLDGDYYVRKHAKALMRLKEKLLLSSKLMP